MTDKSKLQYLGIKKTILRYSQSSSNSIDNFDSESNLYSHSKGLKNGETGYLSGVAKNKNYETDNKGWNRRMDEDDDYKTHYSSKKSEILLGSTSKYSRDNVILFNGSEMDKQSQKYGNKKYNNKVLAISTGGTRNAKNSSDNILVYLYGIGIFGHPKIDVYNEQARGSIYQTYQLINENYKDLAFSRNLQKSKTSKSRSPTPMKIRSNINNINNISNNIVFNNFRKDNSENYSNDNINNSEDELNIKISQLENLLNQERKKNKELIIKINNLENNYKSKNNQEYILTQRIKELERELISLKEKIKEENNSFELTPGEKLLAITFISSFKKINRPIACKNTNVFVRIEEKLYESYPDLKNYDNYFWVNGKKIKRFLTLEENNINDGDRIMLSQN